MEPGSHCLQPVQRLGPPGFPGRGNILERRHGRLRSDENVVVRAGLVADAVPSVRHALGREIREIVYRGESEAAEEPAPDAGSRFENGRNLMPGEQRRFILLGGYAPSFDDENFRSGNGAVEADRLRSRVEHLARFVVPLRRTGLVPRVLREYVGGHAEPGDPTAEVFRRRYIGDEKCDENFKQDLEKKVTEQMGFSTVV